MLPSEWIIVDDGEEKTPTDDIEIPGCNIILVHPEKCWQLGDNTQKRNLLVGLEVCKGEVICIMEDDDYYAPNYLQRLYGELTNPRYEFEAVGEMNSRYYNLKYRKWRTLNNGSFSPLCQTIFRRSLIAPLKQVLAEGETRIDVRFWKKLVCPRYLYPETSVTVGIKGMPGRPGLGIGHNAEGPHWRSDNAELDQLRKWIGDDADFYMELG